MSTKNQLPGLSRWSDPNTGIITQSTAFFLQQVITQLNNLPSGTSSTILSGLNTNKGVPTLGDVYFSTDTGQIWLGNGLTWVLQTPALTGDVTTPIGSTATTLANVNTSAGVWGDANNYPIITVNAKGLITNVTLEPTSTAVSQWQLPFHFGDATPELVCEVPPGTIIDQVDIIIFTAFDGVGASLSVGSAGAGYIDLMATSDNYPADIGTFITTPGILYSADTLIYIQITPGSGATAGYGQVVIRAT